MMTLFPFSWVYTHWHRLGASGGSLQLRRSLRSVHNRVPTWSESRFARQKSCAHIAQELMSDYDSSREKSYNPPLQVYEAVAIWKIGLFDAEIVHMILEASR